MHKSAWLASSGSPCVPTPADTGQWSWGIMGMPPLGKAHPVGAHRCAVAAANSRFHAGREKDWKRKNRPRLHYIFWRLNPSRARNCRSACRTVSVCREVNWAYPLLCDAAAPISRPRPRRALPLPSPVGFGGVGCLIWGRGAAWVGQWCCQRLLPSPSASVSKLTSQVKCDQAPLWLCESTVRQNSGEEMWSAG
jgi:hypothetical protein